MKNISVCWDKGEMWSAHRQDHRGEPQVHQVRGRGHREAGAQQAHVCWGFLRVSTSGALCCAWYETNCGSWCYQGTNSCKESTMAKKAAYQKYLLKMIPFLKLLMYGPSKTYPFLRSECSNKTIQHRFHFLAWLIYLYLIEFIWIFWSTLSFARNKLSLFLFTQPYSAYEVFFERKLVAKCSVCFVYFEIRFNKVSNMGFSYLDKIRQKK